MSQKPAIPPMSPALRRGLVLASIVSGTAVLAVIVAGLLVLGHPGGTFQAAGVSPHDSGSSAAMRVDEGQAFTLDGQHIDAGWSIEHRGGRLYVESVTFTGDDDSVNAPLGYLDVSFVGTGGGTETHCTSEDTLEPGSPNAFDCPPAAEPDGGYDHIVVTVRHDPGF